MILLKLRDILRLLRAQLSFLYNKKELEYNKKDQIVIKKISKIIIKFEKDNKKKLNTHKIFSQKVFELIKKKTIKLFTA